MPRTKFQPNIPSNSGQKIDFNGFAIFSYGGHLGFSIRLNFIILKSCSLLMQNVKPENNGCSG